MTACSTCRPYNLTRYRVPHLESSAYDMTARRTWAERTLTGPARTLPASGDVSGVRGEAPGVYTILWEFRVPSKRRGEFEQAYAADGPWADLSTRADGFLGVQLLRCTEQDGRYLTVDRWRCRADFLAFQRDFRAEYSALDRRLAGMAEVETRIGAFDDLAGS
jgi:heme-degrading monooxygenase HmoA